MTLTSVVAYPLAHAGLDLNYQRKLVKPISDAAFGPYSLG